MDMKRFTESVKEKLEATASEIKKYIPQIDSGCDDKLFEIYVDNLIEFIKVTENIIYSIEYTRIIKNIAYTLVLTLQMNRMANECSSVIKSGEKWIASLASDTIKETQSKKLDYLKNEFFLPISDFCLQIKTEGIRREKIKKFFNKMYIPILK